MMARKQLIYITAHMSIYLLLNLHRDGSTQAHKKEDTGTQKGITKRHFFLYCQFEWTLSSVVLSLVVSWNQWYEEIDCFG